MNRRQLNVWFFKYHWFRGNYFLAVRSLFVRGKVTAWEVIEI